MPEISEGEYEAAQFGMVFGQLLAQNYSGRLSMSGRYLLTREALEYRAAAQARGSMSTPRHTVEDYVGERGGWHRLCTEHLEALFRAALSRAEVRAAV